MIIFDEKTLKKIITIIVGAFVLFLGWCYDYNREKAKEERVSHKDFNYVINRTNHKGPPNIYVEYDYLDSFIVQDYFTGVIYSGWGDNISNSNKIRYEQKYIDGKKHGPCKDWYKNGQLKKEEQYKQGKRYGVSKGWYENGELSDYVSYINGFRDGLTKKWHENGQLKHQSMNHLIMILDQKTQENVWKHWISDEICWDEYGNEIECDEKYSIN